MPIAVTLWYMSMDLVPMLFGFDYWDWELRKAVSAWFGMAMILLAFWIDLRSRFPVTMLLAVSLWRAHVSGRPVAHEFGPASSASSRIVQSTFHGADPAPSWEGGYSRVFGGLGIAGYLGHLYWAVFRTACIFPSPFRRSASHHLAGRTLAASRSALGRHLRGSCGGALRELIEAERCAELLAARAMVSNRRLRQDIAREVVHRIDESLRLSR